MRPLFTAPVSRFTATMCNHYRKDAAWRTRMDEFSETRIVPEFDRGQPPPNTQGPDLWPGYTGEILASRDGALTAEAATWLFVPFWYRKSFKDWRKTNGGCNNAKGETADTSGVFKHAARTGRCLIPGDAFFEYAKERGADGKKPEYRFSYPDGRPFFFAGLRGAAEPEEGPMLTYTMVTKPPGPDVQSIGHHRQPVILADDQLDAWLDPVNPVSEFLEVSPEGTFRVELAKGTEIRS
jgi:putative SOS response-associated peptidase YedK